jgi:L-2-hydroxyglutarate oxidase LhgO
VNDVPRAAQQEYSAGARDRLHEVGEVVVALDESERSGLERSYERAQRNGVPDLAVLGPEGLREIEPQ